MASLKAEKYERLRQSFAKEKILKALSSTRKNQIC